VHTIINTLLSILSFGYKIPKDFKDVYILKTGALGDFLFLIPSLESLRRHHKGRIILIFLIPNKKTAANVGVYNDTDRPFYVEFFKNKLYNEVIYMKPRFFQNILLKRKGQKIIITGPGESPLRIIKKIIFFRLNGVFSKIIGVNSDYYRIGSNIYARNKINEIDHYEANLNSLKEYLPELLYQDLKPVKIQDMLNNEEIYLTLEKYNLNNYIVISIGSLKEHKKWPVINYIDLIRYILSNSSHEIVLTGTKKDLMDSEKITNEIKSLRIINLVGRTSLKELFIIISKSEYTVGNDGGAMHVAGIFGIKSISISPSLEPEGSIAPFQNKQNQIYNKTTCSPCYSMNLCPISTNKCIRNISVQQVIDKI